MASNCSGWTARSFPSLTHRRTDGTSVLHPAVHEVKLARQFADMVRRRDPSELDTWLEAAPDSRMAALKGLAQGVWSDLEAVREGMRQT